ncbi:MAG: hypothetical protein AB7C90_00570 [Bacteroidales bacterium]
MASLLRILLRLLPMILTGSSCLSLCAQEALPTLLKETMPRKASDLVHSVGVNTHFGYSDTQYARYEELLKPRLLELGVKHFRDGTFNPEVVEKYKEMGKHGLKLLLITRSDRAVVQARQLGDMLFGLEGENEPDNRNRSGWESQLRAEQQALFTAVKSNPATQSLPVVVSSLANIRSNPGKLGNLEPWLDFGNMHPYAAGQPPSRHWGWGLTMQAAIDSARLVSGNKPLLVTECGYHNKENNPNHPGVSELAAAIYHPRLIFVYFNQGIVRSYKYEFLDLKPDIGYTDMECHFGLIRADGSPKPSFFSIKNTLAILNDTDTEFTPEPLFFSLESSQPDLHYTLLQKSDGSHWLVLFREVSVYDLATRKDLPVRSAKVTLSLRRRSNLTLFEPNQSSDPLFSRKMIMDLKLELYGEMVIVKISSEEM